MSSVAKCTVNKLRMLTVGIATTVLVGSGMSASYADSTPAPDCTIDAGKTCQLVFTDTSRVSTWTVPNWVTSIDLTIQGGVGGPGGSSVPSLSPVVDPFFAQVVSGALSVTAGSTLEIAPGSGGGLDPSGIANAGINPMRDYDGGAGIDRVVGGGAASVVSVDGSTYVVGGTAGASRRFAKHAPNGTSSNGADAIGIPGYKQVMQYFGDSRIAERR